jgi:hypothetical protein
MSSKRNDSIYEAVVSVTHTYLGPAADRFVVRQIRNHLGKDPTELQKQDLIGLIDWIRLAMTLLSGDEELMCKYAADLYDLTDSGKPLAMGKPGAEAGGGHVQAEERQPDGLRVADNTLHAAST